MSISASFEGHGDFFEDLDVGEKPRPGWLKYFWRVVGVVLSLLVVLYGVSYYVGGFFSATVLKDNVVDSPVGKIVFSGDSLASLLAHYVSNEHREIRACLLGYVNGSTYSVNDVYFPPVSSANVVHISAGSCPERTIADLHSHPVHRCLASEQDLRMLRRVQESVPGMLMIVMCSTKRFAVVL